jgi:hypothetical protein
MAKTSVSICVVGVDPADSSESASSLREFLLNRSIEQNVSGLVIDTTRSDDDAQDVSGDVLHILHTGVLTALFIVESIQLWRETRRDKALIIEAKHGSAIRVELSEPDAAAKLQQALNTTGSPTENV